MNKLILLVYDARSVFTLFTALLNQLQGIEDFSEKISGRQQRLHKNIGMPNAVHIDKWRDQLSWQEIKYFEGICGELLLRHGYNISDTQSAGMAYDIVFYVWLLAERLILYVTRLRNAVRYFFEGRLLEVLRKQ